MEGVQNQKHYSHCTKAYSETPNIGSRKVESSDQINLAQKAASRWPELKDGRNQ